MKIILFLTLGLLVFPSRVIPLMPIGLLIAAFLIFIARPAGVFIGLAFSKTSVRSKLFISWVGLRGAVPISSPQVPTSYWLAIVYLYYPLMTKNYR